MPINQDQFWGSNAKVCVTYPTNSNVAISISDSQQKYVALIAMRRSGGISKILFMKKIEIKSVRFISNKSLLDWFIHHFYPQNGICT